MESNARSKNIIDSSSDGSLTSERIDQIIREEIDKFLLEKKRNYKWNNLNNITSSFFYIILSILILRTAVIHFF